MHIACVPRRFVRSHWGGTETVILETSRQLLARGHDVRVLCPNALARTGCEWIGDLEVRRLPYFYPYLGLGQEARARLDHSGGNLFSVALLRALLREPRLDLIHLHTAKRVGGIARCAARRRGIPYVVSLHGGLLHVPAEEQKRWTAPTRGALEWGRLLGWLVGSRRVLDDAAAILCVGPEEHRLVARRYPRQRVVHLPNGVDTDRFRIGDGRRFRQRFGVPEGARVLLTVARLDPQKNQRLAVAALAQLALRQPAVHLVLVGPTTDETYAGSLRRDIAQRGLGARVTLTGGLDATGTDLVDAYHAAEVFVLPSTHEPFGIAVLEAWAAGCAVVASRVGGVPSVVTPWQDGLLFDPGDREGLVDAVSACLSRPELARRLAASGRERAERGYSWARVTNRLEGIYEEVLREAGTQRRAITGPAVAASEPAVARAAAP